MITLKEAALDALLVQTACNLSGVVHSLAQAVEAVWEAAREEGRGTAWVNAHPVVRLYVDKLASLAGVQGWGELGEDYAACQALAELEGER